MGLGDFPTENSLGEFPRSRPGDHLLVIFPGDIPPVVCMYFKSVQNIKLKFVHSDYTDTNSNLPSRRLTWPLPALTT